MKCFTYKAIFCFCALSLVYTMGFKVGRKAMHTSTHGQDVYESCIKELENRCDMIINPIQQDTCIARVFKLKMIIDQKRIE